MGGLTPLKIIFQKFGGAGAPPSLQVGNPMVRTEHPNVLKYTSTFLDTLYLLYEYIKDNVQCIKHESTSLILISDEEIIIHTV